MSYICFNPKCQHHKEIPDSMESAPFIKVHKKDAEIMSFHSIDSLYEQHLVINDGCENINRYKYRTDYGDEYYLCDACHEAAQFERGLREWNTKASK